MKKITILILMVFGYFSNAIAIEGVNIGVSITGGAFELDGGKEEFKGAHVGGASPGDISKATSDDAEGAAVFASVFAEYEVNDQVAFGIDYVPQSLDTETSENVQNESGSDVTNKVQVDFTNLATLYARLSLPDLEGVYIKAGYIHVDVETNENLGTGGAYPDAEFDGCTIAVGYDRALDNDAFVRLEAMYMDFDGDTVTSSNDSTKSITADGLNGYGARISIGRSF